MGSLLFILYAADVEQIATQHSVDLHSYADDDDVALQPMLQLPLLCSCVASVMLIYELGLEV